MKGKFRIYLLDMSNADYTNGVDRYLACLLSGLSDFVKPEQLYHIQFVLGAKKIIRRIERHSSYIHITIPLPESFGTIVSQVYWSDKYNEVLYKILHLYFEDIEIPIIHIHTLNLIDLAVEIKKHVPAHIITHMHCIPWKNSYNIDKYLFNKLYEQYYVKQNDKEQYYTNHSEKQAYTASDKIVTCTECGKDFICRTSEVHSDKVTVISNGINDSRPNSVDRKSPLDKPVKILYVGAVVDGKGIFFILEALRLVLSKGYSIELNIAGTGPDINFERIRNEYVDVPTKILGTISFEQLQDLYCTCDIGIIGSIQEQNSYVAIEMAMFGLPIITTAVDGLDEMFTNGIDALKIPVNFDHFLGLSVDIERMESAVIELITCDEKRNQLSCGVRRLYEKKYALSNMTDYIIKLYESIN